MILMTQFLTWIGMAIDSSGKPPGVSSALSLFTRMSPVRSPAPMSRGIACFKSEARLRHGPERCRPASRLAGDLVQQSPGHRRWRAMSLLPRLHEHRRDSYELCEHRLADAKRLPQLPNVPGRMLTRLGHLDVTDGDLPLEHFAEGPVELPRKRAHIHGRHH